MKKLMNYDDFLQIKSSFQIMEEAKERRRDFILYDVYLNIYAMQSASIPRVGYMDTA